MWLCATTYLPTAQAMMRAVAHDADAAVIQACPLLCSSIKLTCQCVCVVVEENLTNVAMPFSASTR